MATPIFPRPAPGRFFGWRGFAWEVEKTPEFRTLIQASDNGREARVATRSRPRWHFLCRWNLLKDQMDRARNAVRAYPLDELQTFYSFLLARLGSYEAFLIRDDTDHATVGEVFDGSVSADAGTDFPLVRRFGSDGFVEPVGGIDVTEPITVYIDGDTTLAYTPNVPFDGWIRFDSPPATGATLKADFSYLFKVRFAEDKTTVRTFARDFWDAAKVALISVFP